MLPLSNRQSLFFTWDLLNQGSQWESLILLPPSNFSFWQSKNSAPYFFIHCQNFSQECIRVSDSEISPLGHDVRVDFGPVEIFHSHHEKEKLLIIAGDGRRGKATLESRSWVEPNRIYGDYDPPNEFQPSFNLSEFGSNKNSKARSTFCFTERTSMKNFIWCRPFQRSNPLQFVRNTRAHTPTVLTKD